MEQTITCINCPVGCRMQVVTENGEVIKVTGNSCPRGMVYAKQESVAPMRMVTAVVQVSNSSVPVSVKTKTPIPKEKIFECMQILQHLTVTAPIRMGQVICENICSSGVDVIATKAVE